MTARPFDPLTRLQSVPPAERLDFLADLPREEFVRYKRVLSTDELRRVNQHIDARVRRRKVPTVESWLADARAGKASSPEAMVAVLVEVMDRLKPADATWVRRLKDTSDPSRRQVEVIRQIYGKYFER